ncbi:hypothetical protein [uncultured Chitinophaga sp.]|jgi:hypothetical protein|uniref:hypothetical protein n=1 Tax=uncultured Chitinophaga sp. TaxID=339340 RepID=UPI0026062DEA|nr:hypothetical protein [uncultured Chitinophaga sp.]
MKKLTIQLTATFTFLLIAAFTLQSFKPCQDAAKTAGINFQVTTSSGCTVEILGNASYDTPPLKVIWSSGRVSLSGRCGNTTADLIFYVITNTAGQIVDIEWNVPESADVENLLADPEIEDAFKAYLEQVLI